MGVNGIKINGMEWHEMNGKWDRIEGKGNGYNERKRKWNGRKMKLEIIEWKEM